MSKKKTKEGDFIQKAYYKGGADAMKNFILSNLKYPPEAAQKGIEGTVHVQYHINQSGKVFKAKALTKHGYGLEEEAIRLIKLLRFEVPKRSRHLKIIYNKTTHIHFRLPKAQPPTPQPPEQLGQPEASKPSKSSTPPPEQNLSSTFTTTANVSHIQYQVIPTPPKPPKKEVKEIKDKTTSTSTPQKPSKVINYTVQF